MMTVYNSMSNLGSLNLASLGAIILIDQVGLRLFSTGLVLGVCLVYQLADQNILSLTLLKNISF